MGMKILLPVLLLLSAQADDPRAVAATIDTMTRAIPGYRAKDEGPVAGDDVFLARVMKDLVGQPPTPAEVERFAKDPDPARREKKIDELLADARFGAFWARRFTSVFFGDGERVRWSGIASFPDGYEAARIADFTWWLDLGFRKDRPWTETVSQMLEARGSIQGDPALPYLLSFHRGKGVIREFAEGTSRHFLGIRLACARCHDHPFDQWRVEEYFGMGAFVGRQRAEVKDGDVILRYGESDLATMVGIAELAPFPGAKSAPMKPSFLFGGKVGDADDRMQVFSKLMTTRANLQLPRMLVNRVWGWLMGRGLVHPVDDFNLKNKPASQPLLEALTKDVADHGYSVKRLVRSICLSAQYQMPDPADAPGAESFRHLAARKTPALPYVPAAAKPALEFQAPAEWVSVRDRNGSKGCYVIPDSKDPARFAEISLHSGKANKDTIEEFARQIAVPQTSTETIDGKVKITLVEKSGQYWCQRNGDGPVDYRLWVASFDAGKSSWYFRASGPGDLLDPRRADFVAMLRSVADPAR